MARTLRVEFSVPGPDDAEIEGRLICMAEEARWRTEAEADYVEAEVLFGAYEWDVAAETVETAPCGDEWDVVASYAEDTVRLDLYNAGAALVG